MTLVALGFPELELQHGVTVQPSADPAEALDAVQRAPASSGVLLLARDQPDGDACAHQAALLRTLCGRDDVAVLALSQPVTRAALLLRCLDFLHPYLAPLDLHAVVRPIDAALRTVALVDRVSGLRRPAPSVAQHGLGLLPGSRFAVDLDAGTVGSPSLVLPAEPDQVVASAAAAVGADAWLAQLPGAAVEPTVRLLDVAPRDFWGARRWAELTVLPEPLESVVERALSAPATACPACERRTRSAACPYCGVVTVPAASDPNEVPVP